MKNSRINNKESALWKALRDWDFKPHGKKHRSNTNRAFIRAAKRTERFYSLRFELLQI